MGEKEWGGFMVQVSKEGGWRWSAARGYLDPARERRNLSVVTGALVRRIVFEGQTAVGIEYRLDDGTIRVERCSGEILLSASAMNSPKLLMLSGVGDPKHLAEFGIPVG